MDSKKKEVMKKMIAKCGKGGPGSGGVGKYAIDDPTKAEANMGKGGPGYKGKGGLGLPKGSTQPEMYKKAMDGAMKNAEKTNTMGVGFGGEPKLTGAKTMQTMQKLTSPKRFDSMPMPKIAKALPPKSMNLKDAIKKAPAIAKTGANLARGTGKLLGNVLNKKPITSGFRPR